MPKVLRHLTTQLLALAQFFAAFVLAGLKERKPRAAKRKAPARAKKPRKVAVKRVRKRA